MKVYEYGPRMLHSKALLCDDDLAIIGSANFDHRSFRLNFEVSVMFRDRGAGGRAGAADPERVQPGAARARRSCRAAVAARACPRRWRGWCRRCCDAARRGGPAVAVGRQSDVAGRRTCTLNCRRRRTLSRSIAAMHWLYLLLALAALAVAFKTTSVAVLMICLLLALGLSAGLGDEAARPARRTARAATRSMILDPIELRRLREQAEARRAAAGTPPARRRRPDRRACDPALAPGGGARLRSRPRALACRRAAPAPSARHLRVRRSPCEPLPRPRSSP